MTAVDTVAMAREARELLARCGGGVLHIHGVGQVDARSADLLLYDDAGRPRFLCDQDSPVTRAANERCGAVLAVEPAGERAVSGLVLAGRLCLIGVEHVDGEALAVIGLDVASVTVEWDDPAQGALTQCRLPLAEYRQAVPDPMATTAHQIIAHSNACHGSELRAFVAGLRHQPEAALAAAEIVSLDSDGMQLRWLDQNGSHTARVVFSTPADSPCALGRRVREALNPPNS